MDKKIIFIALIIILVVAAASFLFGKKKAVAPAPIANFEECAAAGYPIVESYPRQCRIPDGKIFTEQILATPTPSFPEIIPGVKSLLYKNQEFGFNLWYPEGAGTRTEVQGGFEGYLRVTSGGARVVGIFLSETLFQGTNLSEAAVLIGVSSDSEAIAKCRVPADSSEQAQGTSNNGDDVFNVFISTGAAAGNFYESIIYRTIKNGSCYEIVEMLHSGNIGNYPPGTVAEFDKPKFSGILEKITQTFVFTPNAESGVMGTVTRSPICPVEKIPPDPACAPQPYETSITITKDGFSQEINSYFDGRFKVALAPGIYQFQAKGGTTLPRCNPVTVEIKPQSFAWVAISCDTGIR